VIVEKCNGVRADDMGNGSYGTGKISCPPPQLPLLDNPEGPIIAIGG
jgi:hypothetical protein